MEGKIKTKIFLKTKLKPNDSKHSTHNFKALLEILDQCVAREGTEKFGRIIGHISNHFHLNNISLPNYLSSSFKTLIGQIKSLQHESKNESQFGYEQCFESSFCVTDRTQGGVSSFKYMPQTPYMAQKTYKLMALAG